MKPDDFARQIRSQQDAQVQQNAADGRQGELLGTIKGSGDQTTAAVHDLMLATLVGKDPRLVDVAENLAKLLEGISKASGDLQTSGLGLLPEIHGELVKALRELRKAVSDSDTTSELVPYLRDLTQAVKAIEVQPNVTMDAPKLDLAPLQGLMASIERAVSREPDQGDNSAVVEALDAVRAGITDLINKPTPVAEAPLAFKNTSNQGVQATLIESTTTPGVLAIPVVNADGSDISGGGGGGGLTDAQLRASPVVVDLAANNDVTVTSGSITANAGTNLNTSLLALEAGGNLAASAASLSVLDDWDESDRAKVNPIVGQAGVQGASGVVSATTQRVVLATDVALPTGTNAIGKLAANSGVDIGDVDITSIIPATGATNLGKAEDAAHASSDTGVATWAVRNDGAATSFTNANGDYNPRASDAQGRIYMTQKAPTATLSNVSGSATSVTVLASNTGRLGATVVNDSTAVLYLNFGGTASTTSYTYKMNPAAVVEVPFGYTGILTGLWASATGAARVTEFS